MNRPWDVDEGWCIITSVTAGIHVIHMLIGCQTTYTMAYRSNEEFRQQDGNSCPIHAIHLPANIPKSKLRTMFLFYRHISSVLIAMESRFVCVQRELDTVYGQRVEYI